MKAQVIEQFKQRIKNPRLQDFLKSDADYKSAYEKVKEYTDDFDDFEMSDNSPMVELMAEFNKGATAYYQTTPNKSESYSKPKSPTPPKLKKGDRVKNKEGKKGTIYDVFERTAGVTYSVNWDGSRIGQAGIPESSLKKLAKVTKEDVKKVTKAGVIVRKAKTSRKATAKPRVKVEPVKEKPKATAKPKAAAKPKTTTKPKTPTKPKAEQTPKVVTHIETPEHKQIKRFLGIRTKETKQLAMTAYKSLQKDITERKIRKTSPQASIITAIQRSYYKYLVNETSSLLVAENILKDAKAFVGSQKQSEIVELVKRFIRFTGVSPTEKQINEFKKDAQRVLFSNSSSDAYYDELLAIYESLKTAKVGDTIIADNVGLSGLKANTVKIRK